MDAPTSASADNGTSGGNGGGGWFTPHKQPEAPPGEERETPEGNRLASMRPVGRIGQFWKGTRGAGSTCSRG